MDEFYTVNQAAITLKVHPLTIRRYLKEGRLKAYKVGGNIRISVNDLRMFTQTFSPHQPRQSKAQNFIQAKEFSFKDPLLSLKGKGLSINKSEQE